MQDQKKAESHLEKDKKLVSAIKGLDLPQLDLTYDVYEGLLSSITSQQLSVKAASTIYGRFLNLFENRYPSADMLMAIDHEELRSVGLSNQKSKYVKNVAIHFTENNLFEFDWSNMSDEEIINELSAIKGVGRWTVEMILMFTLGRPDVMPVGDLAIQQSIAAIYKLKTEKVALHKEMLKISKKWSPHRTLACRYLWAYKNNAPSI